MTDSNYQGKFSEEQMPLRTEQVGAGDVPHQQDQLPAIQEAGGDVPSDEEKMFAVLSHALVFVGGFLIPLIFYFIKKDESKFVAYHALQSVYFQLAILVVHMINIALCFVCIGFFFLPVIIVIWALFSIKGAIAANKGEWYSYPYTGSFVDREGLFKV